MPKLWRRLGRQRNRSQGSKPQVVTPQTMKSQSINPQSTKLQAITLQRIEQRSFPQHRTKSESTTPESSKPPSFISHSEEDGEMEGYESMPERYWACCDCAEGGMSTFIECCSECKHYRCEDCPVELLKHRISDKSLSDAFAPLDDCGSSTSRPSIDLNPKLQMAFDRQSPWWTMKGEVNQYGEFVNSTPSSKAFQTSLNGKSLPLRNRPPETGISAGIDKEKYSSHQDKFWKYQFYHAIDSCISTVLSHRRSPAAQTIPSVHKVDSVRDNNDSVKSTPPPSDAPDGNEASRSFSAEASNLSSSTGAGGAKNSQTGKRGPNSDGQEDYEKSDQVRRKRRLPSNSTVSSPTFACHFHKRDPHKYCSFTNERYRNCIHPRIPSIRRIKDHFKNHRIAQCERCYTIFDSKAELVSHRGEEQMCNKGDPSLKEGINDGEWEKIEQLVKARAHPGRQDYDKWYDIWGILFPETQPPLTPWNGPERISTTSLRSADEILADISASVADGVQRGALPPDERVHREYIAIIQRALGESRYNQPRADAVVEPEDYFTRPLSYPDAPEEEDTNIEQPQLHLAGSNRTTDQNITSQSAANQDNIEAAVSSHQRSTLPATSAAEPFKRWSTGSYPSDNSMSTIQSSLQSMAVQTPIDPPMDAYPEVIEIPIMQDGMGWDEIRNIDILEDFLDDSFFDPVPKDSQYQ